MPLEMASAALSRIRLYPIKSLNPVEVSEARIGRTGGLLHDRVWALYASDGRWINGKRTPAVHFIEARFAADLSSVQLSVSPERSQLPSQRLSTPAPAKFAFPSDAAGAAEWFSAYFAEPVTVRHSDDGFPDDDLAPGPTIVSTASLEAVCSWFPPLATESARLRFRANLEMARILPFEEDRLFAAEKSDTLRFTIGEVEFEGSNPCARCAVPARDPFTAESIPDFQKRFATLRQTRLPAWSPDSRFDHFYRFAVNTRVPPSEIGKTLRAGDALTIRPRLATTG
jgi:MOSC domain-containing protein